MAMLRIRSANSGGSASSALRTSRANRARRRSDTRSLSGHAADPHPPQGAGADAAHARLRQADLLADLAQREPASVGQHEHAALEGGQVAERARHACPALVPRRRLARAAPVRKIPDAVERDLEVGRGKILADAL